jgi:exodeoxyribonuclease-3
MSGSCEQLIGAVPLLDPANLAATRSREAYRLLVAQGWTDALRSFHPGEHIYTFCDYFRNAYSRDAGLRIDHLLLSPAIAGQLKAANVDRQVRGWEKTSDHAPTWIELNDRPSSARSRPERNVKV